MLGRDKEKKRSQSHPRRDPVRSSVAGSSVIGLFRSEIDVVESIAHLKSNGLPEEAISIVHRGVDAGASLGNSEASKVAEQTSVGVLASGAVGWMVGAGILSFPGAGLLTASGPLLLMLASAGALGAAAGIVSAFVALGFSEHEASHYAARIHSGDILLSATTETKREQQEVELILIKHNADWLVIPKEEPRRETQVGFGKERERFLIFGGNSDAN